MNELDPDFFEAELRKLNPAPPPENFMARLSDALPAARPSARPLPKQGVRGTRWSLTLPHLLRWAAPAAITGVLLVVLAIRQSSAPATKSNPGTPPDPMGTVVNADDVEIDQQLVATFDAVARLSDGEPVRFRCSQWVDDVLVRDSGQRVLIEQRTPRLEIVAVSVEVY